ncbi:hypothetical protein OE88DRAFT_1651206 [Heliocybe sulcata]|uniref:Uncharacterized protein n=1 Tax=Heliocybe sulcata TaxID=5364 RepID=A0A5C3NJS3_9AGAM|nr:hypothetical protein OE88DRAFT_1651206 [Heliocybe sulcata]
MANIEDQSKALSESAETGALLQNRPAEAVDLATANAWPTVVVNGVVAEAGSNGEQPEREDRDVAKLSGTTSASGNAATTVSNGVTGTAHAAVNMLHPKKFSPVKINKKFFKSASLPGSNQTTSTVLSAKMSSATSRPIPEASNSHSRLVTAKLTSTPRPSSTTGPGWSRPSSAAPSPSTPGPPANVNKPPSLPANPAVPHLPVAGKVIQPQPRASATGPSATVLIQETLSVATRPVWGNLRNGPPAPLMPDARVQNDFPTAAEVAQVRAAKLSERKVAAEEEAAHQQALQEEADAFRGVHLNPNVHHWDEMEEDDENFLGGVIDFGDGRQYNIQPSDSSIGAVGSSQPPKAVVREEERHIEPGIAVPVRKEERFVDDFDRSWPRSRPPVLSNQSDIPPSNHPLRSPLDSSRVLFNERSNRLEPYSGHHQVQRHGSPNQVHPSLSSRRSSRSDQVTSPIDLHSGRDLPPHHHMQNVSLLQKPEAGSSRSRGAPGAPALSPTLAADRWREPVFSRGPPPPPSMARTISQGSSSARGKDHYNPPGVHGERPRDSAFEARHRRLSASHPPPLPLPVASPTREAARQVPPHLVDQQLNDKLPSPQPISPGLPPAVPLPVAELPLPEASSVAPVVIDDETRKAAMHSAAERARLRRQQEEEERERERERARRKAAELEEKMKALEAEKMPAKVNEPKQASVSEQEVIQVIEAAVRPTDAPGVPAEIAHTTTYASSDRAAIPPTDRRPSFNRPPSQRTVSQSAVPRPPASRKTSFQVGNTPATSNASEVESWRTKATLVIVEASVPRAEPIAEYVAVQPSVIPAVESLSVAPDEQLEEFDFADLGKLVGIRRSPAPPDSSAEDATVEHSSRVHPSRPVASDFFESPSHAKTEESSWRRKQEPVPEPVPSTSTKVPPSEALGSTSDNRPEPYSDVATAQTTSSSASVTAALPTSPRQHAVRVEQAHVLSHSVHSQASAPSHAPRSPRFKEASMSTLDDTMSRIKGVLADMHVHDHDARPEDLNLPRTQGKPKVAFSIAPPEPLPKPKFIPPALRPKPPSVSELPTPDEVFDATGVEPPRSPKPAWNTFVVRLPKQSRPVEPLPKWRMSQFGNKPHQIRWDILSWNPPVEGMNRRLLSVDAILFPVYPKGKPRYRVLLPRMRPAGTGPGSEGPTVSLPSTSVSKASAGPALSVGAFGRPRGADSVMSWRQAPRMSTEQYAMESTRSDSNLETVSRSPPPETPLALPPSGPTDVIQDAAPEAQESRSKSQPKMPSGSGVAFYKDARVNIASADVKPSVNFTVTSELEEAESVPSFRGQRGLDGAVEQTSAASADLPSSSVKSPPLVNGLKTHPPKAERPVPDHMQAKSPRNVQDEAGSKTDGTSTSAHTDSPWGTSSLMLSVKDTPARGPDPEHLKAVWSQASDKAHLPSFNSLEGIGDDLTALPFTVAEVKSEYGETPPPTAPGMSSRMSIQDVTRAFQQVPSSSSSSSTQRMPLSPPTTFSAPRPMPLPYPPPPHSGMRPAYATYPSPMLSSPSPTVVYPTHMAPSPVPGRMPVNGHAPQYSQVWVPVPAPPGGMMRAVPYGSPMMAYPSPISATPLYPPPGPPMPIQSPSGPQPNGPSNRSGGVAMMSPVMSHGTPANPMYSGSPVMVHASHLPVPSSYPSHNQQRPPYDNAPRPTGHQPTAYASPPAFARSAW